MHGQSEGLSQQPGMTRLCGQHAASKMGLPQSHYSPGQTSNHIQSKRLCAQQENQVGGACLMCHSFDALQNTGREVQLQVTP